MISTKIKNLISSIIPDNIVSIYLGTAMVIDFYQFDANTINSHISKKYIGTILIKHEKTTVADLISQIRDITRKLQRVENCVYINIHTD